MKPIIMEMKDMSDSTEIYGSKPSRAVVYTIYTICFLFVIAFVWMAFFKIELVVKSNGMFRSEEPLYEVSSGITGEIQLCEVRDGQLVKEGDTLFTVGAEQLYETIQSYQEELAEINQRLAILQAYEKSLDEGNDLPDSLQSNIYYEEFADRQKLLHMGISLESENTEGEMETYQGNIDTISGSIEAYQAKKDKLNQVKNCIRQRTNTFGEGDSYYSSIVTSYISGYDLTKSQYDSQIKEYKKQKEEYDNFLNNPQSISENGMSKGEVREARQAVKERIVALEKEKNQALSNLELQQIASVEQMIGGIDETILSLKSNLTSSKLQLTSVENIDSITREETQILTEKGNVAAEILSYQSKAKECENYLKNYDEQNNNCKIVANASGYFYMQEDVKQGSYVQEGGTIGNIYPTKSGAYYAEVYVANEDIAKLTEGQKVNFEIGAYPSGEYGYFTGKIDSISRDITIDQGTGSAYYLVKVNCENTSVQNKDGEVGSLRNGMACQAKIVTGEETVLRYLLRKVELLD